jgi:hypothetical protein
MRTLIGQVLVSYSGKSWTKTSIGWPFGQLQFADDSVCFSARWPKRSFRPITLHRDDITNVAPEGTRLLRQFGRGLTFHTTRGAESITFFAYGKRNAVELEQ